MTEQCGECFSISRIPKRSITILSTDICFDQVKGLVYEYTMQMHDMCADRKTDECSYVQPVSLKLFGDISHIALSDYAEN